MTTFFINGIRFEENYEKCKCMYECNCEEGSYLAVQGDWLYRIAKCPDSTGVWEKTWEEDLPEDIIPPNILLRRMGMEEGDRLEIAEWGPFKNVISTSENGETCLWLNEWFLGEINQSSGEIRVGRVGEDLGLTPEKIRELILKTREGK